jgi:peptide/nickel transport system permease protein
VGFAYFALRRLGSSVFVLFGVTLLTFTLAHAVNPDPVAAWLGRAASIHPELVKFYVEKYHLNAPLLTQYFYYVIGLLQGNLGFSPVLGEPVAEILGQNLPYTLQLLFFTFFFTTIIGITAGALAAKYANRLPDAIIRLSYMSGIAAPAFFLALTLIVLFGYVFPILPTGGSMDMGLTTGPSITGFPMLDSLLTGNYMIFENQLAHIILPSLANSLGMFGAITRVLRSSMLDTLKSNYIRFVRAKGASENLVFFRHALRNSLIPVVTLIGLMVNWFIASSIFVEYVFSYPGVGYFAVQSVLNYDYPGILSTTLLFAVMVVTGNVIADLSYAVIDPRIRLT